MGGGRHAGGERGCSPGSAPCPYTWQEGGRQRLGAHPSSAPGRKWGLRTMDASLSTLCPKDSTHRPGSQPEAGTVCGLRSGQLCPPSGLGPAPGSLETPWPHHPGCPQHRGLALPCEEAVAVCGGRGRPRLQHRRLHGPCLSFPICELGIRAVPPLWVFEDGVTGVCAAPGVG